MVITCQNLSKYLCWLRRSDYSAFVSSLTIKSEMSTRIFLAYENRIYVEMCVVMMTLLTGFRLCIFFNKEIVLVAFVFYFFKKAVSLVKHSDCITLLTTGSVARNHIDWKKKHITAQP